jgi:hypothetical protein
MQVFVNKIINWIKANQKLIKYICLGLLGLVVIYYMIFLFTPKPQMPTDYKNKIDSLSTINSYLVEKQKQTDSLIKAYETKVDLVDVKINNIKEKTTIIREYYHEIGQKVDKYTPTQIDSFFKVRYKY